MIGAPPAEGPYRVGGIAVGRFPLGDGRPAYAAWQVELMVEHFRPGTVPVLNGHAGEVLGFLDSLWGDGPDLHFIATLTDPSPRPRLRRGVPVSLEVIGASPYRWDPKAPPAWLGSTSPAYAGIPRPGPNLTAVALLRPGERPAARDSVAWLIPD
jgi:hypothetical protein